MKARKGKRTQAKYKVPVVQRWLADNGIPPATPEHQFALGVTYEDKRGQLRRRQWAFDFAWPDYKVALEVEGLGGRHQFMSGFIGDIKKYTTAASMGWLVLRCLSKDVCMETTAQLIKRTLALRKPRSETITSVIKISDKARLAQLKETCEPHGHRC